MVIKVELNQIQEVAKQLLASFGNEKIIAFYGTMGAGKTTIIKALCEQLGSIDTINSPTFSIVNEYFTNNDLLIYHFDFYRLNTPEEALDIGIEEYLNSGNYCFLEWPEKIESLLSDNMIKVYIETLANTDTRILKIVKEKIGNN